MSGTDMGSQHEESKDTPSGEPRKEHRADDKRAKMEKRHMPERNTRKSGKRSASRCRY